MQWNCKSILTAFPGVRKKILLNLNLMAGSIYEYREAGLAAEYHNNSNGLFYRMPFTLESVA